MKQLRRDPIGPLLAADDAALRSLARRELLGESTPEISLAELPGVRRAVARQQPDGRWKVSGREPEDPIVPEAEQCISYRMPAFKLRGKTIAGFAAFKDHLSYLPHSGSVIPQLAIETAAYTSTRGSLHFPIDEPLPEALVRKLLEVRMAEAFGKA